MENPFTEMYYQKELESLKYLKTGKYKNLEIQRKTIKGRFDGYGYKNWLIGVDNVPIFKIDEKVWMSLTPLEVESHFMPIEMAQGIVGIGGLGMGYYVERIKDKEEVDEIHIYELNPDVIDFYFQNFGQHPKIHMHCEDVLKVREQYFDFFYMDIYPEQMMDDAISHMALMTQKNQIEQYHFWTFEAMLLAMLEADCKEKIPTIWRFHYFPFLQMLHETKKGMILTYSDGEDLYRQFEECGLLDEE